MDQSLSTFSYPIQAQTGSNTVNIIGVLHNGTATKFLTVDSTGRAEWQPLEALKFTALQYSPQETYSFEGGKAPVLSGGVNR